MALVQVTMQKLFERLLPLRGMPVWVRYGAATLGVLLTLGLRMWLPAPAGEHAFIIFLPAVVLASVLFDRGTGIWAGVLSTLVAIYFFVPPARELAVQNSADFMAALVFLATALALAFLVEALHTAFHDLHVLHADLERAHAETELAVQERDLLLAELSHRVKNDMTLVAASLQMQGKAHPADGVRSALSAAANRIGVIARAYTRLSRPQRDLLVDSRTFIEEVCEDLRLALAAMRPLSLSVESEAHHLPIARVVAVGLIVNELVTNAFKYGFPDDRVGRVTVLFRRIGDMFTLHVCDNGVGYQPREDSTGLGARVVRALAAQLDGTFMVTAREPGTECVVAFPA